MISHQPCILLCRVITPNAGGTEGKKNHQQTKPKHLHAKRDFTTTATPQILGSLRTTQLIHWVLLSKSFQ